METVQGKELEKMFKEEGVFDEDDIQIKYETNENLNISSIDSSNSDTGSYIYITKFEWY
jgi:hypothetical protein